MQKSNKKWKKYFKSCCEENGISNASTLGGNLILIRNQLVHTKQENEIASFDFLILTWYHF